MSDLGEPASVRWRAGLYGWLLVLVLFAMPGALQGEAPSTASVDAALASGARPVLQLERWRFAVGDDPRFGEPDFDDSQWPTVDTAQPLSAQGIDPYSGYAWYRLHLTAHDLSALGAGQKPMLMVRGRAMAQFAVYVNGLQMGASHGMTEQPVAFNSTPLSAYLPEGAAAGTVVVAIRSWVPRYVTVKGGVLGKVELGAEKDMGERLLLASGGIWNDQVTAGVVLSFLFVCVALLGGALYVAQRNHAEYLWLSLLCLAVAGQGAEESLYSLAVIPLAIQGRLSAFLGHLFIAVTLEFIHRFTGAGSRRGLRMLQAAILVVPFFSLVPLGSTYAALALTAEVTFCGVASVLLFRGWRKGQTEAGVMLIPFLLAAVGHSADSILSYAAQSHWIPQQYGYIRFHMGPIAFDMGTVAYGVFLGSLLAVILYRFIRVSQDEQRSSAEIEAARSVQAMLIPTQLPSSRNFMLESAYLPVNGVGGDFFQVLPLKDESLLIVVGDVSGKGLQAAMNSSSLVGALRNELSHEPATVLEHLNRVMLGAGYAGDSAASDAGPSFATCLCARVYPDGTLQIANAGHLGPYRDGREMEIPPGLPLGVIAGVEYEQVTYHLEQGERLVFLSDGVVEAVNAQGELFGFERTQQVSNEPARYIAQTAKRFGQTDDITVVSLYMSARSVERDAEGELSRA